MLNSQVNGSQAQAIPPASFTTRGSAGHDRTRVSTRDSWSLGKTPSFRINLIDGNVAIPCASKEPPFSHRTLERVSNRVPRTLVVFDWNTQHQCRPDLCGETHIDEPNLTSRGIRHAQPPPRRTRRRSVRLRTSIPRRRADCWINSIAVSVIYSSLVESLDCRTSERNRNNKPSRRAMV